MPEMPDAKTMAELTAMANERVDIFLRPSLVGKEGLITYKVRLMTAHEEALWLYQDGDKSPWGHDELVVGARDMSVARSS